ncbi:FecCD family ABC transporter permease [Streptococcus ratti]|uniref:FecCD family ABC transporter permease n=1 Tax=Streptococcus ratti TaxID=1341 RepID=UPI0024844256|nr:iron ABC transporter permease [Streptococcus ratti]
MPILFIVSLLIGSSSIDWQVLYKGLFFKDAASQQIIYDFRLPRLLIVILAGLSLSLSGYLMQTVAHNRLASPSMLGLVDGALLGVVLSKIFKFTFFLATPLLAILGSLLTIGLIYLLASLVADGFGKTKLILIGIMIGNLVGSVASLLALRINFFSDSFIFFLGTVSDVSWWDVLLLLSSLLLCLPLLIYLVPQLAGFALGDDMLYGLGKPVKQIKLLAFLLATILSATTVSVVGKLNFIGLIVPNIVYLLKENRISKQLLLNILVSLELMIVSDILSKLIRYPYETPLAFVISLVGIPFFFYILRTQGGKERV